MNYTKIIKGLLDILNSNHEKMKLTIEQVAVKNEAHKLVKSEGRFEIGHTMRNQSDINYNSVHPFTHGCVKLTADWRAALQSDRDMKNNIAKSIEPVDICIINKITPSNCRGLK